MADLSVAEKLLLAATNIEDSGKKPFTAEDLVIAAWRKFPDTFGLSGYYDNGGIAQFPDSNRVFAEIMGSKPIRKKGFLRKVGTKLYEVTEAGHEYAKRLDSVFTREEVKKTSLSRDTIKELKRLLLSKAVEKTRQDRASAITFYDACNFWGISPRSSFIELEGRLANFEKIVAISLDSLQGGIMSFEHGGIPIGSKDLYLLKEVHSNLLKTFAKDLDVIKRRRDERA